MTIPLAWVFRGHRLLSVIIGERASIAGACSAGRASIASAVSTADRLDVAYDQPALRAASSRGNHHGRREGHDGSYGATELTALAVARCCVRVRCGSTVELHLRESHGLVW